MLHRILAFMLLLTCLPLKAADTPAPIPVATPSTTATVEQVVFSPKGGCEQAVVKQIESATTSIYVQAYAFTSIPIANALITAANVKHIPVKVIMDAQEVKANYPATDKLVRAQSPYLSVLSDSKHAIAHNKVIILDATKVITGSFNFTFAAETRNAENLLVLVSKQLADTYTANWQLHASHSKPVGIPLPPTDNNP